jgi:hypothetical protein
LSSFRVAFDYQTPVLKLGSGANEVLHYRVYASGLVMEQ